MIKFSEDYKEKYFGLKTKANEYDKWVHFAGCFTLSMLLSLVLGIRDASVTVFIAGIVYEIYQGIFDPWGFSFIDIVANFWGCLTAHLFISYWI